MSKSKIMKVIIIIAVLAIPIMYSFFYLKAYWDPYGNLADIRIAMVNLDTGYDGKNQGQKLVDTMTENGTFSICDVTEEEADSGLVSGSFYAVIKIPSTFSKDLNSANTENKQISKIIYSPNQKTNFLASQIINSAIKTMEINLQAQVAETITDSLASKLKDVPDSLNDISEGAGKILDGSKTLSDGVGTLSSGAKTLKGGTDAAYQGALKIESEVLNSIDTLKNNNEPALDDQTLTSISTVARNKANVQIEEKAKSIGEMASNSAKIEIANQSENIGAGAASSAVEVVNSRADNIGTSAANSALETINSKSEGIGIQAAREAQNSIDEKLQEIGDSAKTSAVEQITGRLDLVSSLAVSSTLESINSNIDNIGANAANTALSSLNQAQIEGMVELSLCQNESYINLPDEIKPYIMVFSKSVAWQTAQTVASQTSSEVAKGTAQTIAESVADQVSKSVAMQVAGDVASGTAQTVAKQVAGEVANGTAQTVAKQVTGEVASSTAKVVAGQVAGEVASTTAKTVADQVAGQVANSTAQTVAKQVAGDVASQTSKTVAVEVSNEVKKVALNTVADKMVTLKDSINTLSTGLEKIDSGTGSLVTGINRLSNGSDELTDGISLLKTSVDEGNIDTKKELKKLDGLPKFANNPLDIEEQDYGKVNEYGLSFLPLFLSIGLWVGVLMLYVVIYYDQDKRFTLLIKGAKNSFLQMGLYFALAVAQGIVTGFLLKVGLKFEIANVGLYYFTCILLAMTFLSIMQFLIMNFGDAGKFIALIILVLQLAAAGGTFPIETVSKGFQKLNPFLPMTYAIKLVKESVIMKDSGFAIKNILILSLYLIIPLAITLGVQILKTKKQEKTENAK